MSTAHLIDEVIGYNSHAMTLRHLIRFFIRMEQRGLQGQAPQADLLLAVYIYKEEVE